ncbi:unnamed protein product, partial [Polarella glacialis]
EHVFDSFNANSEKAGNVMDLIDAILRGEKVPADLPLIRVAARRGHYWCIDNRRCFVYKHCQLGKIPVEVFEWKDNREFELKYRNGFPFRQQTGNGQRAGLIQRTEIPFPRSPVAENALSTFVHLMGPEEQERHEAAIATLRKRREVEAASGTRNSGAEAVMVLLGQKRTSKEAKGEEPLPKTKKKKRKVQQDGEKASETTPPAKRKKKKAATCLSLGLLFYL